MRSELSFLVIPDRTVWTKISLIFAVKLNAVLLTIFAIHDNFQVSDFLSTYLTYWSDDKFLRCSFYNT